MNGCIQLLLAEVRKTSPAAQKLGGVNHLEALNSFGSGLTLNFLTSRLSLIDSVNSNREARTWTGDDLEPAEEVRDEL